MDLLFLSAEDLRHVLPMADAIEAMKYAFGALSAGEVVAPRRAVQRIEPVDGTTLLMSAFLPGSGLAAKVVSIFPRNAEHGVPVVNGLVLVLDPATGAPRALLDGTYLTAWRTGAASGAATDLLARADARVGAILGCGAQAHTQLAGILGARALAEVRVFARHRGRGEAFVAAWQDFGPRLRLVDDAAAAVAGADVVCVATSSRTPVLAGDALAAGAHVNGVGSFRLDMRELDGRVVERARVFVDHLPAALAEAGDLVAAEREGRTHRENWTELGDVVRGAAPARRAPDEITLFKSVGQAVQDVAAACAAVQRAEALGLGRRVEL